MKTKGKVVKSDDLRCIVSKSSSKDEVARTKRFLPFNNTDVRLKESGYKQDRLELRAENFAFLFDENRDMSIESQVNDAVHRIRAEIFTKAELFSKHEGYLIAWYVNEGETILKNQKIAKVKIKYDETPQMTISGKLTQKSYGKELQQEKFLVSTVNARVIALKKNHGAILAGEVLMEIEFPRNSHRRRKALNTKPFSKCIEFLSELSLRSPLYFQNSYCHSLPSINTPPNANLKNNNDSDNDENKADGNGKSENGEERKQITISNMTLSDKIVESIEVIKAELRSIILQMLKSLIFVKYAKQQLVQPRNISIGIRVKGGDLPGSEYPKCSILLSKIFLLTQSLPSQLFIDPKTLFPAYSYHLSSSPLHKLSSISDHTHLQSDYPPNPLSPRSNQTILKDDNNNNITNNNNNNNNKHIGSDGENSGGHNDDSDDDNDDGDNNQNESNYISRGRNRKMDELSFYIPEDGLYETAEHMEIIQHEIPSVVSALSISTYPYSTNYQCRVGDPICDQYHTIITPQYAILALADGCNWGIFPRDAATISSSSFTHFVHRYLSIPFSLSTSSTMTSKYKGIHIKSIKDIAELCLKAVEYAHNAIISEHDIDDPLGTTTLIGGIVFKLPPPILSCSLIPTIVSPRGTPGGLAISAAGVPSSSNQSNQTNYPSLSDFCEKHKKGAFEIFVVNNNNNNNANNDDDSGSGGSGGGERKAATTMSYVSPTSSGSHRISNRKGLISSQNPSSAAERLSAHTQLRRGMIPLQPQSPIPPLSPPTTPKNLIPPLPKHQLLQLPKLSNSLHHDMSLEVIEEWGFVAANIGDCKAFKYCVLSKSVEEITSEARGGGSVSECGGRIGPYDAKNMPDLANLKLFVTSLRKGDLIILCTDGVHDNLDPEIQGKTPSDLGLQYRTWKDSSFPVEQITEVKSRYQTQFLLSLINTCKRVTPTSVAKKLVNYSYYLTNRSRNFMEKNETPLPADYRFFPGKMDHTSVIVYCVGGKNSTKFMKRFIPSPGLQYIDNQDEQFNSFFVDPVVDSQFFKNLTSPLSKP